MKYSEIRHTLNTGDILLFAGKGVVSSIIQWFTKSRWSHVAMVIRSKELDILLSWESTTLSKVKDIKSGTAKQGVQLVALSDRINTYDGVVAVRQLVDVEVDSERMTELQLFRDEVKNRPYEESKIELAKSAYDGLFGTNEEDLTSLFCSELIAEAYQRMGFLTDNIASNEYTPADFGGTLDFLTEGKLGEIIELEV